ncbi:MAG: ABC-F family ATP-binding cassette domain-containing protein [Caldilinea sp.]|nr:ABC-F family ATP-binding cassette domain-containing protein [Caldilineaceae bacterium]MCB9122714.1 ABC-F family ATP-binding cassette domain-containing protein [Caldilineaceae bacterium]MCW5844763.1 ABC-F family ATP-binding cassette domain-containing protein [Caldilinea sp.]
MSTLTISNLGFSFGDYDVFLGISASIPNDGKIGLVGPNGIGKTTLLRVLAGLAQPSVGSVTMARGTRIGYLRQEAVDAFAGRHNTVYDEMLAIFAGLREQEAMLRDLEHRMADAHSDDLLAEYSVAQDRFEHAGGYEYEQRISQVLYGLGFARSEWNLSIDILSGGQKTRALLARLLLERPDLLILDEPTNHLDVQAVEWLEGMLRTWDGSLLIVSHDRYFLDNVVNRIWEMGPSGFETYHGNYSHYLQQRQERWERRETEFNAVKERFLSELDYIKRNIARDATKNQAVGRLRRLIREVRVVEAGGLDLLLSKNWGQVMDEVDISEAKWGVADVEQAIKGLRNPVIRPPQLNLKLKTTLRSGNLVLRTSDLTIGYPGKPLFTAEPITLERGECAALIGPNGSGKTTFLRTLLGELQPLAGQLRPGASLKVGYFSQAHERLNPNNTVLDELLSHKQMLLGPARNYLAQYLFRGEDVFKPVRLLSGGERGRLALAILALEGANFLLLDEPSNHLDIPAQEILQAVLEHFDGTILLVSHDRYLIDHLATQVWELRKNRLEVFPGTYAELIVARQQAAEANKQAAAETRSAMRSDYAASKQSRAEERKRAKAVADAEERVHALEARLARLENDLHVATVEQDLDGIQRLGQAYTDTQVELEAAMEEWAELA